MMGVMGDGLWCNLTDIGINVTGSVLVEETWGTAV